MRHNRIAVALGLANLALFAFLVGKSGMGPAGAGDVAPVVRAGLIELVDAAGAVRAQIKTEEEGTVALRLRDADGNVRVKLAADELGSGLLLADNRTDVGIHLLSGIGRLTNEPDTMIALGGPDGARRVIRPGDATE